MSLSKLNADAADILSYVDPTTRHALRATCTAMYLLPVAGSLRIPIQSRSALALMKSRASCGFLERLPFWGLSADRVSLWVIGEWQNAVAMTSRACQALEILLGTAAPQTIEFFCRGGSEAPLDALEWLAHRAPWPAATIELGSDVSLLLQGDMVSDRLKERLTWCEAVIRTDEKAAGSAPPSPFVVLRNASLNPNARCLLFQSPEAFPAVVQAAVDKSEHIPQVLAKVGSLAGLTSLVCMGESSNDNWLGALPRSGVMSGDQLTPEHLAARWQSYTLCPAICKAVLQTLPEGAVLPCTGLGLHDSRRQAQPELLVKAAERIVEAARHTQRLRISSKLVTEQLVQKLPPSVRCVTLRDGASREALEPLMTAPSVQMITTCVLFVGPVCAGVREIRAAHPERAANRLLPNVYVPERRILQLQAWSEVPAGVYVHTVQLGEQTLLAEPVPTEPTDWSRAVEKLEMLLPLGQVFWSCHARLSAFFPNVKSVDISFSADKSTVHEVRSLASFCAGLSKLQHIHSIGPHRKIRAYVVNDKRVRAACPWLYRGTPAPKAPPLREWSPLWNKALALVTGREPIMMSDWD